MRIGIAHAVLHGNDHRFACRLRFWIRAGCRRRRLATRLEGSRIDLCHTSSGDVQIHIVVDGVGKVCQLTGTGIAEDEVLAQAGIRLTHIEVLIGNAVDGLFAGHLHARPVTVQVVGIAPHVEIQSIPARLVVNKHGITVVLHAGL